MRSNRLLFTFLTGVCLLAPTRGQQGVIPFYEESLRKNNYGMIVLGSWALANISAGAIGWSRQSGQQAYFHQMNLFWNTVNLSIAGFALYSNLTNDYLTLPANELLDKQLRTQRIFLINGLLDVGYVATGLLLTQIAARYPKNEFRLKGYGNSVILQGSFLFVFDMVMYALHQRSRLDFLDQVALAPMQGAWGVSLSMQF